MIGTFSSLLYDVQWHTIVLQSILVESRDAFTAALCNGTLHPMDEFALQIALEEDKNALMERPASMKLSLADQLLDTLPRKLLFPSPEDVNLLGAAWAARQQELRVLRSCGFRATESPSQHSASLRICQKYRREFSHHGRDGHEFGEVFEAKEGEQRPSRNS